jgi:NhaC family Na+:H+ antiporter
MDPTGLGALSSVTTNLWNLLPIFVLLILASGGICFPLYPVGTWQALMAVVFSSRFSSRSLTISASAPPRRARHLVAMGWLPTRAYPSARSSLAALDMLTTVAHLAPCPSAVMDYGGFNKRLIDPVIQRVKSDGGTIATTMLTSLGLNIVGGDQYIAIVLPARMFMETYQQRGLHPETLATAVENSGTVTSPLIPWNLRRIHDGGAGVSTFVYFRTASSIHQLPPGMSTDSWASTCISPESQPAIATLPQAPLVDQSK